MIETPDHQDETLRFDHRPLAVILLARSWPGLLVSALLILLAAVHIFIPTTGYAGIDMNAWRVLAVFFAALTLWVTSAVPLVVTAIGVFIALSFTGIASPSDIASWYWKDIVFFLLGAFLIAGSLSASHVVDHAALRMIDHLGTNPRRLRQVLFWSAFGASFLMSEHAVMAMMFPLACRIRDALGRKPGSSTYVTGLFFALAWGATIGGIVTYLGGGRNPLAMGFLVQNGHEALGFFSLMWYSLPIAVPLGIIASLLLERAFPVDISSIAEARAALAERRRELGRFGPQQMAVTGLLLVAILGWAFAGYKQIAVVALAVAALLLGSGLVRWKDLTRNVPWDLLLLYGAALALAKALETTGAHKLAAEQLLPYLSSHPLVAIGLIATCAMLLTEAMSNAAVVGVMVPLMLGLAPQLGLDPLHLTLAVSLSAGLAFMLPMGSPPLAIAFASGEFKITTMAKWGALLNIIAIPLVMAVYWFVWR
jgi:sodium-dependent dicarboxylate transporter 2/3/5